MNRESPTQINSCVYRGYVSHRRFEPAHQFRYSTSWMFLDLDEIDYLVQTRRCFSTRKFAPMSFFRSDHAGDPQVSLKSAIAMKIREECGVAVSGPIRLLTQLRHFGVYFSPINVYYCFADDQQLVALVAEVSNTPWNERHSYVLWEGNRTADNPACYSHPKAFHVSPFMDMHAHYDWQIHPPDAHLKLSLACRKEGKTTFHAALDLRRVVLTDNQLMLSFMRRPIAAAHIMSAIYFQALRLWIKKCQFYPHPQTVRKSQSTGKT